MATPCASTSWKCVDAGPRRVLLDDVMADIHLLLAHYMRALVVLSAAAFTAYSIFFAIISVPYGVLLAAVGGMLEFIPMIGPLTAAVLIVGVSLLSGSRVLAVLIFLAAYRVFQDYILLSVPDGTGRGTSSAPGLVRRLRGARRSRESRAPFSRCRCWRWSGSSTCGSARRASGCR